MANNQLQDTFKVSYAASEADADQNPGVPGAGDSVVFSSDSPNSITVVPDAVVDPLKVPNNPDGTKGDPTKVLQTGFIVGGKVNKVGCQVTATYAHTDGTSAPPPVVLLFDNVVGPLSTGAVALGTPVSQ